MDENEKQVRQTAIIIAGIVGFAAALAVPNMVSNMHHDNAEVQAAASRALEARANADRVMFETSGKKP